MSSPARRPSASSRTTLPVAGAGHVDDALEAPRAGRVARSRSWSRRPRAPSRRRRSRPSRSAVRRRAPATPGAQLGYGELAGQPRRARDDLVGRPVPTWTTMPWSGPNRVTPSLVAHQHRAGAAVVDVPLRPRSRSSPLLADQRSSDEQPFVVDRPDLAGAVDHGVADPVGGGPDLADRVGADRVDGRRSCRARGRRGRRRRRGAARRWPRPG